MICAPVRCVGMQAVCTGAVLATKGKEVTVAEGADIAATLSDPFEMRVRVE